MLQGDLVGRNRPPIVEAIKVARMNGSEYPAPWNGIIDTGADRSVIPLEICKTLEIPSHDKGTLGGFDPSVPRKEYDIFRVKLTVDGFPAVRLEVYGIDERQTIILGRDFLAGFALVFDSVSSYFALGQPRRFSRKLMPYIMLR